MKNIFICCLILLMASCVKDIQDIPPNLTENPIFKAGISVDGNKLDLNVGMEDYVMLTKVGKTNDELGFYASEIKKKDCLSSECGPRLIFRFYENGISTIGPGFNISETLVLGEKQYFLDQNQEDSVKVVLSIPDDANFESAWHWNNSGVTTAQNNENYEFVVAKSVENNVCLNTYTPGPNGPCLTQKCLLFTPDLSPTGCNATLKANYLNNQGYVVLTASSSGEAPFTYNWGNGVKTEYLLLPAVDSTSKLIQLTVTDATGCKTKLSQIVRIQSGSAKVCPLDYSMALTEIAGQSAFRNDKVEIVFIDEAGRVYESNTILQPQEQMMEILDVSDFGLDPNGLQAKQVSLRFKGLLFNATSQSTISIESASEVVIAVSFLQ